MQTARKGKLQVVLHVCREVEKVYPTIKIFKVCLVSHFALSETRMCLVGLPRCAAAIRNLDLRHPCYDAALFGTAKREVNPLPCSYRTKTGVQEAAAARGVPGRTRYASPWAEANSRGACATTADCGHPRRRGWKRQEREVCAARTLVPHRTRRRS